MKCLTYEQVSKGKSMCWNIEVRTHLQLHNYFTINVNSLKVIS